MFYFHCQFRHACVHCNQPGDTEFNFNLKVSAAKQQDLSTNNTSEGSPLKDNAKCAPKQSLLK